MNVSDVIERLFPGFDLIEINEVNGVWVVNAVSNQRQCECPSCGQQSSRIHSQYERKPLDVSWGNYPLDLNLRVFRFFCDNSVCRQRVFCQRHVDFLSVHAQATKRFNETMQEMAQELGGEGGCRLGSRFGIRRSADTYLRHLKQKSLPMATAPRVIGIDDWAWRKGHQYGTIICDLERGKVIDILPDREVATVVAWLQAHPTIEVITRDRAKCYREAATTGAPQAVQIADRWHLLKNLRDVVKRTLEGYQPILKEMSFAIHAHFAETSPPQSHIETLTCHPLELPDDIEALETRLQDASLAPATRRRLLHSLIHRLRDAHIPIKEMMARTGVSRATLYRYFNNDVVSITVLQPPAEQEKPFSDSQLRHEQIGQLRDAGVTIAEIMQQVGVSRATVYRSLATMNKSDKGLRDYFPGVEHRYWSNRFNELWQAGYRKPEQIWHILRQEEYTMSFARVRMAVYRQVNPLSTKPKGIPSQYVYRPRKAAWCFVLDPLDLDKIDYQFLLMCLQMSPEFLQLYALAQAFHRLIVHHRSLALFEHWIAQALSSPFPEIQRFARGLLQDESAVRAALTSPWSNGPVEGQVLRLKLKRRSMYGRGSLDLLKRRVMGVAS